MLARILVLCRTKRPMNPHPPDLFHSSHPPDHTTNISGMKPPTMKTLLITPIILTALTGGAHAAGYVMDLGTTPNQELVPNYPNVGLDGWTQSEGNNDPSQPKAWVTQISTSIVETSTGIGLGPLFDGLSFDPFFIKRDVSLGLSGTTLSMNMRLAASSLLFPAQNDFYIALNDLSDNSLLRLNFLADPDAQGRWEMNVNGQEPFGSVSSLTTYELSVSFFQPGPDMEYMLQIGESNGFADFSSGAISVGSDPVVGSLVFGVVTGELSTEWGDNWMGVSDVSLIP